MGDGTTSALVVDAETLWRRIDLVKLGIHAATFPYGNPGGAQGVDRLRGKSSIALRTAQARVDVLLQAAETGLQQLIISKADNFDLRRSPSSPMRTRTQLITSEADSFVSQSK